MQLLVTVKIYEKRRDCKKKEFLAFILVCNSRRALGKEFFSTNVSFKTGRNCKKCNAGPLGKFERVDCEFWPGKEAVETYCLSCWARS